MRRRAPSLLLVAALALVPAWSSKERLALLGDHPNMTASPVALDPADPARRRVGRLDYLGGVVLRSRDPAFGGFSALTVQGDRFTLLSDGGNIVRFRMGPDWTPHGVAFASLPAGPGTGWEKRDRDSEAMAAAPNGVVVAFEDYNQIWRYTPDLRHALAAIRPAAMRRWTSNGGAESLARLPDGRFVVISEVAHVPRVAWRGTDQDRRRSRAALLFSGDPTDPRTRVARFGYLSPVRGSPSDAVALPNGDLLVLGRTFNLPYSFGSTLSLMPAASLRPGAVMRPRLLATLAAPLIHDNFEGLAVTRERGATILWLVSDDNQSILQRTLLLKFRLR